MRGFTLPELLLVLIIIAVLASISVPPLGRALDRLAVDQAASRYESLHESARSIAVTRGRLSRVQLDSSRHTAVLELKRAPTTWDTLQTQDLGRARLSASQTMVTFSPIGIGFGASNTRIVFTAGVAAETVTVARTGRLRRS